MSHPWNAAPAYIIPHYLMGVRPLEPAYRRVLVAPLPSQALAASGASLIMPTLRGSISVSFSWGDGGSDGGSSGSSERGRVFTLDLQLPGNTAAHVCVPAYLFRVHKQADLRLTMDGAVIATDDTQRQGGSLCLLRDVKSGRHTVMLTEA